MKKLKQIKAQDIMSTNHVIKFFDDESFAEKLFSTGEMLFRPIKSFKESKQPGRGDVDEGIVNCHFQLYCKEVNDTLYKKLGDVTAVHLDDNRPIYCYYQLSGRNFHPNGAIYLNPKMLKDFSSGKQTFCAILDRVLFENQIMSFLNAHDIAATIANVKYSDENVDIGIIMQTKAGKSDLAYFQKSKEYEEQQERRIILGESIDSLVKRGIGEKFGDGIRIKIGNLSKMGYIAKPVNFY
ncbi:MAG: hypothetical protein K2L42_01990 [Clostridia bacterium]|nr:hypothetical protein [Clostridia bacterium]